MQACRKGQHNIMHVQTPVLAWPCVQMGGTCRFDLAAGYPQFILVLQSCCCADSVLSGRCVHPPQSCQPGRQFDTPMIDCKPVTKFIHECACAFTWDHTGVYRRVQSQHPRSNMFAV
jgi:hypothetical protein